MEQRGYMHPHLQHANVAAPDNDPTSPSVRVGPRHYRRGSLVVVGQTNPYGGDRKYALYPYPMGSAGRRLYDLAADALGASSGVVVRPWQWVALTDRHNLCAGPWSDPAAREAAAALRQVIGSRPVVLLGRRVADAWFMGLYLSPPLYEPLGATRIIPHTSGKNRAWADPQTYLAARAALAEALLDASRWAP